MDKSIFNRVLQSFIFFAVFLGINTISIEAKSAQAEKQDSIIFSQMEYDFGTIARGSDGTCEFEFINKGDNPLILSNVRATCGCTVPQWPKEPIPPGGKGVVKVKYNTNILGVFNKSVTVHSNAVNKMVILRIKGKVENPKSGE
jgi:hypothetical protein